MEWALYAPSLGYYQAHIPPIGPSGDFITAPHISPLFAECLARQCVDIFTGLLPKERNILEVGAGEGQLAKDLLQILDTMNQLPNHYWIVEVSPILRARQRALFTAQCPHLLSRVKWFHSLDDVQHTGIIIANEVLDALPVHRFCIEENDLYECCVDWKEGHFIWRNQPIREEWLQETLLTLREKYQLPPGYISEINLSLDHWLSVLSRCLQKGVALLLDYGYSEAEYYHPDRSSGTLMCYYQHQRHDNPLVNIGLQDITAHVDFTRVVRHAMHVGFHLAGFTTQSAFLMACGLLDALERSRMNSPISHAHQVTQAIKKLTLPSEMGEAIKVMALSKQLDTSLLGFSWIDRRRDL